jgi:hypothetical protein
MITSHTLMRESVHRHGIAETDIVDSIMRQLAANGGAQFARSIVENSVSEFMRGGPCSVAICVAIVQAIAAQKSATVH